MADTYFEEIDGEFTADFGEGQTLTAVGIDSVEQTVESEEDSGINAFKVVLTDGRVAHFNVRNGSQGSVGPQGPKGDPGEGVGEATPEGGEILGDYEHNEATDHFGLAAGSHTKAGWRSLTAGYLTEADNTSFAGGRLVKAPGKASFSFGSEDYEDAVDAAGEKVYTVNPFHIDDVAVTVSGDVTSLQVGDFVAFKPTTTDAGYKTTDVKKVVAIAYDDEAQTTTITLHSSFRAENYYEGHENCTADGLIPAGAQLCKAFGNVASGEASTALGKRTLAEGLNSISTGFGTKALGRNSGAGGENTIAGGRAASAEGRETEASGNYSHSENYATVASGPAAHAEGSQTRALHEAAHTQGLQTESTDNYQDVSGKWNNLTDSKGKVVVVGWGTKSAPKNIYTLDKSGNGRFAGKVTAGADPAEDADCVTLGFMKSYIETQILGGAW